MSSRADICPVCGMTLDTMQCQLKHQKMHFYFCSAQCRETFTANPALYSSKSGKVRDEIIKRRRLCLAGSYSSEEVQVIEGVLNPLMGIKEINLEGSSLFISYDLLQVTQARIEQTLNDVDIKMANSWWQRLRHGWIHNTEENELKNLSETQRACCNRPPPRV